MYYIFIATTIRKEQVGHGSSSMLPQWHTSREKISIFGGRKRVKKETHYPMNYFMLFILYRYNKAI